MAVGSDDEEAGGLSGNAMLAIGLVFCAGGVAVALLSPRFFKTPPPARPVPVAAPAEHSVNTTLKYTSGYYKATLDEDAKHVKLAVPTTDEMSKPFVYANELAAPRILKADRDQVDTPHLHLATKVAKEWSQTGAAQRLRVEHVMLSITNKSAHPIAYRVETHFPDAARCKSKGTFAQNAIALQPGETVTRSECIWSKSSVVDLRAIEVMEVPDLGYYYLSRLIPTHILLDERTSAGHEPPLKLKPCSFVPWREIRTSAEQKGGVAWADVVDFYARHNCDEYSFFSTYRRWTTPGDLPAVATSRADAPAAP